MSIVRQQEAFQPDAVSRDQGGVGAVWLLLRLSPVSLPCLGFDQENDLLERKVETRWIRPATFALALMSISSVAVPIEARADVSCSKFSRASMDSKIKIFLMRPVTLLELYPRGDQGSKKDLQINIRELVAVDMQDTLAAVIKLVPQSNVFQKQAIGAGLGSAAKHCTWAARPVDARTIMQTVRLTGDRTTFTAFMVAYIDAPIHPGIGDDAYTRATNPLGLPQISSPGTNVFKDGALRDPFKQSDPFMPVK